MSHLFDSRRVFYVAEKPIPPLLSLPTSFITPNLCESTFEEIIFEVPEDTLISLDRRIVTFKKLTGDNLPHIEIALGGWPDPDDWTTVVTYTQVNQIITRSDRITQIDLEQPYTHCVRVLDSHLTLDHGYWYQKLRIKKIGGSGYNATSYLAFAYFGWRVLKNHLKPNSV